MEPVLDLNDPESLLAVKYLMAGYALEKDAPFSALARQVLDANDQAWGPADEALWGQMFAGAEPPLGQLHAGLVQPDAPGLRVLWKAAKASRVSWSALTPQQQDAVAASVAPWLKATSSPGAQASVAPTNNVVRRQVMRSPSVVKQALPAEAETPKKSDKGMWFALGAVALTIGGVMWAAQNKTET